MSLLRTVLPIFGLEDKLVDEKTRVERLTTCVVKCDKYFKPTGNCLECGCFVREKVELKNQNCPLNYW